MGTTLGGQLHRSTRRGVSPLTVLIAPASLPFAWILIREGVTAPISLLALGSVIGATLVANVSTVFWLDRSPDSWVRLNARVAVSTISTALVIHSVGWGALLVVTYFFTTVDLFRQCGAKIAPLINRWLLAVILVGQILVTIGVFPSMVPVRISNLAALCGAVVVAAVNHVLGSAAQRAEHAEQQLAVRASHYEALVRHATDIIGVIDEHGTVMTVNPAFERLLGYRVDDIVGHNLMEFAKTQPTRAVLEISVAITEAVQFQDRPVTKRVTLRHLDGSDRHLVVTITTPSRDWSGTTILNVSDVTTQNELERQLRFEAQHDPLTGLLNRKAFADHAAATCRRANKQGRSVAVLYLDLDGFKEINDRLGHEAGDRVLISAAMRLTDALVPSEVVARLGGDEFCILLDDPTKLRPIALAERILEALTAPIEGLPASARVGVSIGIAEHRSGRAEAQDLLNRADEAMYDAKRAGKARYVVDQVSQSTIRNTLAS